MADKDESRVEQVEQIVDEIRALSFSGGEEVVLALLIRAVAEQLGNLWCLISEVRIAGHAAVLSLEERMESRLQSLSQEERHLKQALALLQSRSANMSNLLREHSRELSASGRTDFQERRNPEDGGQ